MPVVAFPEVAAELPAPMFAKIPVPGAVVLPPGVAVADAVVDAAVDAVVTPPCLLKLKMPPPPPVAFALGPGVGPPNMLLADAPVEAGVGLFTFKPPKPEEFDGAGVAGDCAAAG